MRKTREIDSQQEAKLAEERKKAAEAQKKM
jgi:hypothetical protein